MNVFELSAEGIILLVRLALVGLLYAFIVFVVLAARRDLGRAAVAVRAARPAGHGARLVVLDPGGTSLTPGEQLSLRAVTRLGRADSNTIVLDGSFISAEHAAILQRDGGWWVADRGSTNGTSVNDQLIAGEVGLMPGDVVGIGDVRLRIVN